MGKRIRLLATVALPIASLVWQPVYAAPIGPVLSPVQASDVKTVQAQNTDAEELLRRKKQQERQKQRQEKRQKGQQQGKEGGGKAREEQRQQKQRQADEGQKQQRRQDEKARDDRQKQRQAGEDKQRDTERKAREEQRQQKQRQADEGKQKQRDAEREQRRQDEKARDDRQKQRQATEDKQRDAERKAREEQRQREAGTDRQKKPEDRAERRPRKRDAERERIARDPSKTVDTIELPFEGGAAVLDSDKDWDNRRDLSRGEMRRKRAEERSKVKVVVPRSDRDAQVGRDGKRRPPVRYESAEHERGKRRDRRPDFDRRDGWHVERRVDNRVLIQIDNRIIVRSDDNRRLARRAAETYYEDLPHGRVREVIVRPNGDRVVTIRDRYGEVIQRSRIDRSGREYVMFYAPATDYDNRRDFVDPGLHLPPMRLGVPLSDYIIDTSSDAPRDYRAFLEQPPVEPVERVYTLDEVRYSARLRDKVRRIDLDTITFATGSADVSMDQASTLRGVADAINAILDEDPGETFLIEGHTDAVGSDESNLVLSDHRAETVADVLTDVYDIPPENLATQGYGERFLKIDTDGPEQLNRRVTIRRVTPLVKPASLER